MSTLLLVGGKPSTVRKAKDLGLTVVMLQHKDKFVPAESALADAVLIVDYTDWSIVEPLADAVRAAWGVDGVASLVEAGCENAARIADKYDLRGTRAAAAARLRDKWAMRRHLAESTSPLVRAATVAAVPVTDEASLRSFGAAHGYPFVVKPTDATAGYGVFKVDGPDDVATVYGRVAALRDTRTDRGSTLYVIRDFVAEQYVGGPEYSVESFSFAGRHVAVAITEKLLHGSALVELGHALPARVEPVLEEAIVSVVSAFLDDVGVTDGPSHTELRLGPNGPVIIESHNRPGGAHIGELVTAAYGFDLDLYGVAWPMDLVEPLSGRPSALGAGCTRFLHGPPGRVAALPDLAAVRERSDVIAASYRVKVGDVVRPLQDNWDRLGLVAVSGSDTAAAVGLAEQLIADAMTVHLEEV